MPSKRKQINVRLDAEAEARVAALIERMNAAMNVKLTQPQVIIAALAELEKRYPPPKQKRHAWPG